MIKTLILNSDQNQGFLKKLTNVFEEAEKQGKSDQLFSIFLIIKTMSINFHELFLNFNSFLGRCRCNRNSVIEE